MTEPDKSAVTVHALQRIANGRTGARAHALTRETLITIARETCDRIGVPYDRRAIDELEHSH